MFTPRIALEVASTGFEPATLVDSIVMCLFRENELEAIYDMGYEPVTRVFTYF